MVNVIPYFYKTENCPRILPLFIECSEQKIAIIKILQRGMTYFVQDKQQVFNFYLFRQIYFVLLQFYEQY